MVLEKNSASIVATIEKNYIQLGSTIKPNEVSELFEVIKKALKIK